MLYTRILPDGHVLTGLAPLVQPGLTPRELATMQRNIRAGHATLARVQQRCSGVRDVLAAATECLVGSQHFLATSRESLGYDAKEP